MAGKRKRAARETMRLWFAIMNPSGMTISPARDPVAILATAGSISPVFLIGVAITSTPEDGLMAVIDCIKFVA